jgi:hypothetical protein
VGVFVAIVKRIEIVEIGEVLVSSQDIATLLSDWQWQGRDILAPMLARKEV